MSVTRVETKGNPKFRDIEIERPFHINNCFPSGFYKDWTVYKIETFHSDNRGVLIYFHDLKRWVNPPTDTNMEYNIIKKIEKYGVVFLGKDEEL